MYVSRSFYVGVALALAGGVLVAATQASVRGEYDDSPLTVPAGHVGDKLTYAVFDRGQAPYPLIVAKSTASGGLKSTVMRNPTASQPPSATVNDWSEPGIVGFELRELREAPDRSGEGRGVLLIASNRTGQGGNVVEYIDLDLRKAIRTDWPISFSPSGAEFVRADFQERSANLRGLEFQGQTLRLGDDVTGRVQIPNWIQDKQWTYTVQSVVEARVLVDGIDTYVVRTHLDIREAEDAAPDAEEYRIELTERMYLAADRPYPILVRDYYTWFSGQTVNNYEQIRSLVDFTVGPVPIVWSDQARPLREANPGIERSGSQTYPADGSGTRIEYKLSAAIEDVESNPLLVQFWRWRSENPGYRLIGARLTDVASPPGLEWNLIFGVASQNGEPSPAFGVTTTWNRQTGARYARETGAQRMPAFSWNDLPAGPVTLGAAELLWTAHASEDYTNQRVNFVAWGMTNQGTRTREQLSTMRVGFIGVQAGAAVQSSVTLDTVTGNVEQLFQHRGRVDCQCQKFTQLLNPAQVPLTPKKVFGGIQPPTVEEAAVSTSSALGLFLALYFLPLLKFFGGQLLLLVPGYAKLTRDEVLGNKVRDHILQLIRADPGIHASDLARKVEAGWGTIVYHLSVLERNKLVSSLVDGRHKRFFPVGIVDFSRRGQLAVLKNDRTKGIFRMIAEDPGVIQGEIANRTGLSVPAAIWHLRRLEDAGLVGRDKQGRKVHYFANKEEEIPVPYDERDAVEVA